MQAFCSTCDSIQDVELVEDKIDLVFCLSCGDEFTYNSNSNIENSSDSIYNNYKIASILKVEPIPKQKDLKKVLVDITGDGDEEKAIQIVTNAKYCEIGWKVVVALENAIVPAGSTLDDTDTIQIKPSAVGGVMSYGMLCDSPMLKWTGGAKSIIQQLPDTYTVGSSPPTSRPRI